MSSNPITNPSRVRGIDVSEAQGHIDFDKLPAWVKFLVVKAVFSLGLWH